VRHHKDISVSPNAPRFHTLWQHIEKKKRIFAIRKNDWNSLHISGNTNEKLVKLDLEQFQPLPIGGLIMDSDFLGSTAFATDSNVTIKIYRMDPKDEPTPINVDTYTVWKGLPSFLNIPGMIIASSTASDDNFSHYAEDHVFLIKEEPDDDHWLEELPKEVYAMLSRKED
jgi:hypothetical protein